ncbi:MAG: hypothetical protein ACR652_00645 [Methylocystis sp.]|uniref:hypothetical protein n=1 Tax=Methylocystis sp. TaxID=1911079 RepID=UPI003DA31574
MRFYLVYHGRLPASGNKPKPEYVRDIRDQFSKQLKFLWENDASLKRLRQTAVVKKKPHEYLDGPDSPFATERDFNAYPIEEHEVDLCEPLQQNGRTYIPLVRSSLDLNCHLDIHFLRQEDPGCLVLKGGDLDNRIKTLFDALRKPDRDVDAVYPQENETTYCLLESDTLVSGFDVTTGRLLFPNSDHEHEVHLLIEVTVRVLRVGLWNICLLSE